MYPIPDGADEEGLVLLSDIFPTALECGVRNGRVEPGSTVAIVGVGPVGLAALLTAKMYSPALIVVLDGDDNRLEVAEKMGAHAGINSVVTKHDEVVGLVRKLTQGKGCDTVIEAVGVPATFMLAQKLLAPGGVLANVGVHGTKVDLFLDELWDKNIGMFILTRFEALCWETTPDTDVCCLSYYDEIGRCRVDTDASEAIHGGELGDQEFSDTS